MDKKNKILYTTASILILLVVVITAYKIFILHDYMISYEVACDPKIDTCYVYSCVETTGDENCIDSEVEYYKIIERKASQSLMCEYNNLDCSVCLENEINCQIITCDSSLEENTCSIL